jgi:hypothetical protein
LAYQAEILIEELLEHGRLTLEQIIQRGAAVAGKGRIAANLLRYTCSLRLAIVMHDRGTSKHLITVDSKRAYIGNTST